MNQDINIKIMKKPELTDEEIFSHMQFDKLLDSYKVTGPKRFSAKWFYTTGYVTSAVLLISTALYFFLPGSNKVNYHNSQPHQTYLHDSSSRVKRQVIQLTPKIENQDKKVSTNRPKVSEKRKDQSKTSPIDSNKKTMSSQFTEAEPIDGYSALYEYFDRELKYPINEVGGSVEGIVTVSFAINQDGKPDLIKIENSLGVAFDKECQRVINSMPKWKPATISGKPISTRLSIPLTFKIKK